MAKKINRYIYDKNSIKSTGCLYGTDLLGKSTNFVLEVISDSVLSGQPMSLYFHVNAGEVA